ncbi:MAG: CRISPR-associated endonuclease Cas1 [Syntrophomonadaceae bacterium]|nr:CRISPR-associated endonuclease Cas1 [Bacillota bacterium]
MSNNDLEKISDQTNINELLGLEGIASRSWFESLPHMIKREETDFFFSGRNRRPPRDPINALLSFSYSMLVKDIIGELMRVGLDPYIGFLHSSVYGRPALALDLMEEFRPIIADSVVLTAVNTGMVRPDHFENVKMNCRMNESGRKSFFRAYRNRMNEEIAHPVFGYKLSYRRTIELQARILAKVLQGEIKEYIPFTVR